MDIDQLRQASEKLREIEAVDRLLARDGEFAFLTHRFGTGRPEAPFSDYRLTMPGKYWRAGALAMRADLVVELRSMGINVSGLATATA